MYINDTKIKAAYFKWSDDTPVDWFPIEKHFENCDQKDQLCLVLVGDNKYFDKEGGFGSLPNLPDHSWVFEHCESSKRRKFVCEKPSEISEVCGKNETHACGKELICPSLWTYFEPSGACYQVIRRG